MDTVKLINAQTQFAGKACFGQFAQHRFQVGSVLVPDAVCHDLVEAEPEGRGPPAQDMHELGIKEWLTPREAKDAYSIGMRVLQEAQGYTYVQSIRPFNGNAAVRTGQVALIGARERQVVRSEGMCPPAHRPRMAACQWGHGSGRTGHDGCSKGRGSKGIVAGRRAAAKPVAAFARMRGFCPARILAH